MRKVFAVLVAALLAGAVWTAGAGAIPPGPCSVEGLWQGVSHSDMTQMDTSVQLMITQHGRQFDWTAVDEGGIPLFMGHGVIAASGESSIMGKTPDGSAIVHAHGMVMCPADMGLTADFDYHVNMTGGAMPGLQDQGTVMLVHVLRGD